MKEKILAAIKAKYPAINLSKKRLDLIAAKIESKVIDDETKIDAALETFNEYYPITEIAAQDDRLRNAEKKAKETTPTATESKKTEEPVEAPAAGDDPVMAMLKQMSSELQSLKAEKVQSTIRGKAEEMLKDVSVKYWNKRPLPEKEEDLEAWTAEVKADYAELTKDFAPGLPRPINGAPPPVGGAKGVDPGLKSALEAKKTSTQQVTLPVAGTNTGSVYTINTPGNL